MRIEEIEKMSPLPEKEITLRNGKVVKIRALKIKDILNLMKEITEIYKAVKSEYPDKEWREISETDLLTGGFLLRVGEKLIKVLATTTSMSEEELKEIDIPSLSRILIGFTEVNNFQEVMENFQKAGRLLLRK